VAGWERGASGANDLLGGTGATFVELQRLIGEVTGRPVSRRAIPARPLYAFAALFVLPSGVNMPPETARRSNPIVPDMTLNPIRPDLTPRGAA
jgi:hypothetical protein